MTSENLTSAPYLEAMEASIDGMAILDANDRYSYLNQAHTDIYGYGSSTELLGKSWHVLYAEAELKRFEQRIMPFLKEFGKWRGESVGRRKDGTTFSQELSLALLKEGGLVCVVRDISNHKHTQEALFRSQERLAAIIESQQDIIFETDRHGRFSFISPACTDHLGFEQSEMLGRSITDFMSKEAAERTLLAFQAMFRDERNLRSFRIPWLRKDGGIRVMSLNARPTCFRNQLMARGSIRNITKLIELEQQLRHAQKMEAVGALAGGIAHDFNNILTGILGHASLIKTEANGSSLIAESAQLIEQAAQKADSLTKELLGFARRTKLENVAFNLHESIDKVVALLGPTFESVINCNMQFAQNPCFIVGDPNQIEQMLVNLAINARDAVMARGEGELLFRTEEVTLDNYFWERDLAPGPYVRLSVCDNGSGIAAPALNRIFEPFFTTKPSGKGSGMGLAMVYGIIKSHGGSIYVDSVVGRGTTFDIYLPRCSPRNFPAADESKDSILPSTTKLAKRILIIDDEEVVREVGCRMLEKLGFSVVAIGDSREGLEYFEKNKDKIDLVLLDLMMPNMDGSECFRQMQTVDPNVRGVITSGQGLTLDIQRELNRGLAGFIEKPYRMNQLAEVVTKALVS